jgi:hypothetical protein
MMIDKYKLIKVNLVRASCPPQIESTVANKAIGLPIIIEKNRQKHGYIEATGYCPFGVIAQGNETRKRLLSNGLINSWAWVENGALEIQADDAIGCNELCQKLQSAIVKKFYGSAQPGLNASWPSIVEVYPFENYFIFAMQGQTYRQPYTLDPVKREMSLSGKPTKVKEMFIDSSVEVMPRSQTGQQYHYANPHGNNQTSTMGAPGSELITEVVRDFTNINEAVQMYLNAIKFGLHTPMKPAFCPVQLTPDHKIAHGLQALGIEPVEFAQWGITARHKKTKTVGTGQEVHKSGSKPGVLSKIRRAAKHHGIDVSDTPTSGQKKWAKKGQTVTSSGLIPFMS